MNKRTDYCGDLRRKDVGRDVVVKGWVAHRRDLGSLIFIAVRDRTGIVQLLFDPKTGRRRLQDCARPAPGIRAVRRRQGRGTQRGQPGDATGEIEIQVSRLEILNESKTTAFSDRGRNQCGGRPAAEVPLPGSSPPRMQSNMMMRHKIVLATRQFLDQQGYLEIETPVLNKSTPEGARDYLVPAV